MSTPASGSPRLPESIDPRTGESWRTFEALSADRVHRLVATARAAQKPWAALPLRERAAILERVRAALHRRRREIASTLSRETGKAEVEALLEVLAVADAARFTAARAPGAFRTRRFRSRHPATLRKTIEIRWEPYGVAAVIAPWNYPLLLAASPMFPALAAGNAVLLKPSELTPASGALLIDILHEEGVPAAVAAVVQGDGATGAALIDSGIDRLFFTGSVATGRRVAAACAERLIPCSLELGGSDPALVLDDANVEMAAAGIAWGRFSNAGQTCTAPKRAFVHDRVYDRFVGALAREIGRLRNGGPDAELAPLIRPDQAALLAAQREDALARGARVAASSVPRVARAGAVAAEALTEVSGSARVLQEETFGPILPIVRISSDDEAIELANASPFGLSASIWTADARRARRIAARLRAGTVMVNDTTVVAGMIEVPHGGTKASGIGRIHGTIGLTEAAVPKGVILESFPSRRQPWWFPYSKRATDGIDAFLEFHHGRGLLTRLRAGLRAVRLLFLSGR